MASKKKPSALFDRLRKAFMTKDSEGFEKTLDEMDDEASEGGEGQHIHIHMPGAEKKDEPTADDDEGEAPADPMAKVLEAIDSLAQNVAAIGERVSKLEAGPTADDGEEGDGEEAETQDDDGDADGSQATDDEDGDDGEADKPAPTNDSASLRDEFQDAKARAEILAPGVKLPTFDSKLASKKTADSICVLRRRALRAALTNDNADLVRAITGDADVSKMDCAAAKMAFHAASELVKRKNSSVSKTTTDSKPVKQDINQIHAAFWANRK